MNHYPQHSPLHRCSSPWVGASQKSVTRNKTESLEIAQTANLLYTKLCESKMTRKIYQIYQMVSPARHAVRKRTVTKHICDIAIRSNNLLTKYNFLKTSYIKMMEINEAKISSVNRLKYLTRKLPTNRRKLWLVFSILDSVVPVFLLLISFLKKEFYLPSRATTTTDIIATQKHTQHLNAMKSKPMLSQNWKDKIGPYRQELIWYKT